MLTSLESLSIASSHRFKEQIYGHALDQSQKNHQYSHANLTTYRKTWFTFFPDKQFAQPADRLVL